MLCHEHLTPPFETARADTKTPTLQLGKRELQRGKWPVSGRARTHTQLFQLLKTHARILN